MCVCLCCVFVFAKHLKNPSESVYMQLSHGIAITGDWRVHVVIEVCNFPELFMALSTQELCQLEFSLIQWWLGLDYWNVM